MQILLSVFHMLRHLDRAYWNFRKKSWWISFFI